VGVRRKKPPISDTSYSLSVTRGSVGVEGTEGSEERKELVLEE
jgi:hypothetical protein